MHIHASAVDFTVTMAFVILALFILRMIQAKFPDSAIAKGLAFIA